MRAARPALPALVLGLTGCFVYAPAQTRNTPAGKVIEVTLTPPGARALEPEVGPRAQIVAGALLSDDAETLELRFGRVRRTDGVDLKGTNEPLRVPHAHVVAIHERRVSKPRTWAATLGATGFVLWSSILHK